LSGISRSYCFRDVEDPLLCLYAVASERTAGLALPLDPNPQAPPTLAI
jgi:hypothetical protein